MYSMCSIFTDYNAYLNNYWTGSAINVEVLVRGGVKRQLFNKIQKQTYFSDTTRQEVVQREMLEGMDDCNRSRERP